MKKLIFLFLFFILIVAFSSGVKVVNAETDYNNDFLENTYDIIDEIDTSNLDEIFIKNEYYSSIYGNSFKEKLKSLLSQEYSSDNFVKTIINSLVVNITKFLPFFIILFIIAIISGMVEVVKPDGKSMQMSNVIYLVCYLLCITILIGQFIKTSQEVEQIVKQNAIIMQSLMPLMLSLMAVSGMSSSVSIYRPIVLILSNSLISFIIGVLIPLVIGITIINLITQITDKIKFNKLREVLSLLFKWIIGITLTIFSLFITVKGIYTSKADGISMSAIKYITGQVPVVGGFLKEGTDIFVASSLLIKNALGKMAVFIILWEVISPAICILVVMFGLNIIAGISEPFADSKLINCYSNMSKTFGNLLAIVLMSAFMFVLTIIMLIASGSSI